MDKKTRNSILKKFSKQQLEALREYFEEKVKNITNLDSISSFEELLGRKIAIGILKDIMVGLRLAKEKRKRKKNEYI